MIKSIYKCFSILLLKIIFKKKERFKYFIKDISSNMDIANASEVIDKIKNIDSETAADYSLIILKKIAFWSGYVVRWLVDAFESIGFPINRMQITAGLIIISIIIILIIMKFAKPILKIILIILMIWFIMGFFVEPPEE